MDYTKMTPTELRSLADKIEQEEKKIPEMVKSPDLSNLKLVIREHLETISNGIEDDDGEHYIYEVALETIYGKGIWDWINKEH